VFMVLYGFKISFLTNRPKEFGGTPPEDCKILKY
jgi:hypothetical protein